VNTAIYSAPAFADDAVLFGSFDGYLYCLRIDNGELIWRFQPVKDAAITASPLIDGKRIVLAIRRNDETTRVQDAIVVIGEDDNKK
jgi:outer membrane protein assembly factor BamB